MELAWLGWPEDGPTLRLDHERFAYAGKFVMSNTGKAVAREGADPVAATAFDEDRTDPDRLRIRYITVAADRRGEGLGPRLARFVVERARDRGYASVAIAVNNPYAYEAMYRAGFAYTGERTGIAELVLETDADRSPARYRAGLDAYAERELDAEQAAFVERCRERGPPDPGPG